MGAGLGPVQRAVRNVLIELDGREADVAEITRRVYRKLGSRSGYGGWRNSLGIPLEHHYAAVRKALASLPGQGVSIVKEEEEGSTAGS